jgi:microcystin-dependent protein
MHAHPVTMTVTPGSSSSAATTSPTNAVYAPDGGGNPAYSSIFNANMAPYPVPLTTSITGSNIPFANRNPYLVINHIICLEGVFPARN